MLAASTLGCGAAQRAGPKGRMSLRSMRGIERVLGALSPALPCPSALWGYSGPLFQPLPIGPPWLRRFHTDPSGTYVRYEAKAIGSGSEGAQTALQVGTMSVSGVYFCEGVVVRF